VSRLRRPSASSRRWTANSRRGRPSGLFESGVGWLSGGVLPEHRRRGIGSGLFDRIESRLRGLGAAKLEASATDDAGRRFLVARGFEATNVLHRSELDPRTAQADAAPAGVDVAPLRDVLDRAEELYRLFAECRADVPAVDARTAWTYDEWRVQTLDLSLLDHDASVVLLDADEPVSFAWPCRIGREVGRRRSWPARAGTVAGRGS
jgi:GNAT superfamily N-acetyltransferase